MKTHGNSADVPDWKCERYLLGELDAAEMSRLRLRAQRDDDLRSRLAAIAASDREILARHPVEATAREIAGRLEAARGPAAAGRPRPSRPLPRLAWVPVALAAALAAVLFLTPGTLNLPGFPVDDTTRPPETRIKGSPVELSLYRRTASGSERLADRDVAREHDLILARYRADGRAYGLILSVDGRGVVTRHHPARGGAAVPLEPGLHALDFSYELDDAPHWEIFIVAASPAAFAADDLLASIGNALLPRTPALSVDDAETILRALPLPDDVSLATFTLIKDVGDEP